MANTNPTEMLRLCNGAQDKRDVSGWKTQIR